MYSQINIHEINKYLTEARNILIYTLHFPYETSLTTKKVLEGLSEDNNEKVIEALSKSIHQACLPLFCTVYNEQNNYNPEDGLAGGQWQFFGNTILKKLQIKHPIGPLGCLDTCICNSIWEKIITHHCLLSTYDKLYEIIFHDIEFSGYDISRHLELTGIHYALKNNLLHLEISEGKYKIKELNSKSRSGVMDSGTASNYGRNSYPSCFLTIKERFNNAKNYNYLCKQINIQPEKPESLEKSEKPYKPTFVSVPASILPLLQQLRGRGKKLANIFKLYDGNIYVTATDVKLFNNCVYEMQNQPLKSFQTKTKSKKSKSSQPELELLTPKLSQTDKLYYKYKLEQTFNFDFVYCLAKNIQLHDKRFNQTLREETAFIDNLVAFINLPNTFSRHLLIQMAFDCCSDRLSFKDSLLSKRLTDPDSIVVIDKLAIKATDPHLLLTRWLETCLNYINYMTEIVFPIYESYFFVAIYDLFSNSEKPLEQNLLNIFLELGNYIEKANIYDAVHNYEKNIQSIPNLADVNGGTILSDESFISPKYQDKSIDVSTFSKVILSSYNNMPAPKPAFIDRNFLYKYFPHSKEAFLNSCIADILRDK